MRGGRPRPLAEEDLAELVELRREHSHHERAPWVEFDRVPGSRAMMLGDPETRGWVVDGAGELAGFATASLQCSTWDAARYLYLDCLDLRPRYRGRGLGRRLMDEAVRAAHASGAIHLEWQTPSWNTGAARFYGRLGAGSTEKLRFRPEIERGAAAAPDLRCQAGSSTHGRT